MSPHRTGGMAAFVLFVSTGLVIAQPDVALATNPTIYVTTTLDTVASDGLMSLREAIIAADAASGADTISLTAGTYQLSLNCGTDEDANAGGDLDVLAADPLTITSTAPSTDITGPGVTIRPALACTNERLIDLRSTGAFTLQHVVLQDGHAPDAASANTDGADGGAIRSSTATISLDDVYLDGNVAGTAGRATTVETIGGDGGAIFTGASLTLVDVQAVDNHAGDGYRTASNTKESNGGSGGAIHVTNTLATVSITTSWFGGNIAGTGGNTTGDWGSNSGDGGAVYLDVQVLAMTGTTFYANAAGRAGDSAAMNGRDGGQGGAMRVGAETAYISQSTFSDNLAGDGSTSLRSPGLGGQGGALLFQPPLGGLAATVTASSFIANAAGDGGNASDSSGTWANSWGGHGGAIAAIGEGVDLTVASSYFTRNEAGDAGDYLGTGATVYGGNGGFGGAIALWGASAQLVDLYVIDNYAGKGGSGSSACYGGSAGTGGGIAATDLALARPVVSIINSDIESNYSGTGTGCYGTTSGDGGGLWFSTTASPGELSVVNALFADNHADVGDTNSGAGGAIATSGSAPVAIQNVTMHANSADATGGAIYASYLSAPTIESATITGNSSGDGWPVDASLTTLHVAGSILEADTGGAAACAPTNVVSNGYNAELGGSTCTALNKGTDLHGVDPAALLPLADNGGDAGQTRLPSANSALVDVIPTSEPYCAGAHDQRNVSRPVGATCDIGAAELRADEPQLFFPLQPERLVDTRPGLPDGSIVVTKQLYGGGTVLRIPIASYYGLDPAAVAAVSLNVTATQPVAQGYLTVYPCGTRPVVSSVNYQAGQTVPNAVVTPIDPATGDICVYSSQNTHILVDIAGYFAAHAGLTPVEPIRLVDTRPTEPQRAIPVTKQLYGGSTVLRIPVSDYLGLDPADIAAVSLNVTATQPTARGYLTVYPCGTRPIASNVNYPAGRSVPNAVITPVDATTGDLCIYSSQNTHIIVDIAGYFGSGVGFTSVDPVRLVDTRPTEGQGAVPVTKKLYGGATILQVKVTDVAGVPASGVAAVSLNVTATGSTQQGYLSVYPCGDLPPVSSLNYPANQSIANAVITPVDPDTGEICIYSLRDTHVIIDVAGWFLQTSLIPGPPP